MTNEFDGACGEVVGPELQHSDASAPATARKVPARPEFIRIEDLLAKQVEGLSPKIRPAGSLGNVHLVMNAMHRIESMRSSAAPATGWTIELGPFPGWKNLPSW